VANYGDGTVTPVTTATNTPGTPISVGIGPSAVAISPDGQTAYVTDNGNTVDTIDLATQTVETYIEVGNDPSAVAVSPDGTTAYVANYSDGTVTPVATATGTAGAPITVGNGPRAVAVMPDQGPAATLAATTTGSTTTFNASSSVPGSSPIVSYAWNFGDGNTATTSTATTTHAYRVGVCAGTMASPACTATVTLTDAVGASTTQVFTGQTVGLNGSGEATASTNVVIAITSCTADNSCQAAVTAPATASAPAQTVTVTVPSAGSQAGTLTVSTGSGQLSCSAKGFKVVASNVTSYSSTFVPSTNVNVTDFIAGPTKTKGIKICFEGATQPPKYLKTCAAHNPVAPCATLAKVTEGVEASILVPGGDPRFRIDGVQTITENPTAVAAKGVIGKTITIKGTDLLGVTGQGRPKVAFTSLGGSTIAGPVTKATATSITVEVPNGAATGAVSIAWPDETMVSEGSITIT
jgi:YVTN family beta-propeller protein